MSNFTDVIKTINRMPADKVAEMFQRMTADQEAVERDVTAWAKDNPEPRYPTWGEWLCEMGVSRISSFEDDKIVYSRTRNFYEEMDAETAVKLGVEPKVYKRD